MEAKLISEIFNGNSLIIGFALCVLWYLHKEAMRKIDKLTESLIDVAKATAVNQSDIERLRESNHFIINNMLTESQAKDILSKG